MSGVLTDRPDIVSPHSFPAGFDPLVEPVRSDEFRQAADRCGPFESRPRVALAVSGGGDSVALMLLMRDWLAERGGYGFVLTVDHGVRPAAAAETGMVKSWAVGLGFACVVLRCRIDQQGTPSQNKARQARYAALSDWCRQSGVMHLFLAHHRGDQAETFLMRHFRGSGVVGLAAMPMIAERTGLRLIRPLLGFPKERLLMTCRHNRQGWIEDPSNRRMVYERARWRMVMPMIAAQGYDQQQLVGLSLQAGLRRVSVEQQGADLMAQAATIYPQGYAYLDDVSLASASPDSAHYVVGSMMRMVSGAGQKPRRDAVRSLMSALWGYQGTRTLHGCRVSSMRRGWLICREFGLIREKVSACSGKRLLWDRRFVIVNRSFADFPGMVWACLGEDGWGQIARDIGNKRMIPPYWVRLSLPALWRHQEVVWVPHLGWLTGGQVNRSIIESIGLYFLPRVAAAPPPFAVLRIAPEALSSPLPLA